MIFPMRNDGGHDIFLVYRTVVSADGVLPLTRYILTGVQLEIFNRTWDPAAATGWTDDPCWSACNVAEAHEIL